MQVKDPTILVHLRRCQGLQQKWQGVLKRPGLNKAVSFPKEVYKSTFINNGSHEARPYPLYQKEGTDRSDDSFSIHLRILFAVCLSVFANSSSRFYFINDRV